jgi:hypothetical protein
MAVQRCKPARALSGMRLLVRSHHQWPDETATG